MLTETERIAHRLVSLGRDKATDILRTYARLLHDADATMSSLGWERVDAPYGTAVHNGKPVHWVGRKAFVLLSDTFRSRLSDALDAAKKPQELETKSVVGSESLSRMVCQKCGDSLQHTAVCPRCAAGKLGYRHRYTCVCGGVDLISKDKL